MTSPAPGWYPDPGGAAPYRWWNGQAWTTATSAGAPPAAAQPTPAAAVPGVPGYGVTNPGYAAQVGQTVTPQLGATSPQYGGNPAGAVPPQQPYGMTSNYTQMMNAQRANETLWHKNQAAFSTFILTAVAVMLILAFSTPIIIFTPIAAAGAANQSRTRGEPLAPIAMGAAAICIVIGVVSLSRIL